MLQTLALIFQQQEQTELVFYRNCVRCSLCHSLYFIVIVSDVLCVTALNLHIDMASSDDQQAAATDADALVRSPTGSRGEDELFDTPPRKTERDDLMPRLQFDENAASPSPSKPSEYVTPGSLPPSNGSGRADAPATLTLSTESTEKPVLQQEESVEEPVRSKLEARKQLDFESPIPGPGKSRNIRAPTVVTELMDLKVSIVANETRALPKTDPFTVYKIKTDVSLL